MTTDTPEAVEAVAVTQEDRDAAAAYYRERYPRDVTLPPIMAAGQADSGLTIQAFAYHRIASVAAARAAIFEEAAGMWRNAIGNTVAVIDIVRNQHQPKSSNKAFSEFDAALNAALDGWFKLTRNAKPETWEESEALFKEYSTAIRTAGSKTDEQG